MPKGKPNIKPESLTHSDIIADKPGIYKLAWIDDPSQLEDNPDNWRKHPGNQTKALMSSIRENGWAGALLYNEVTKRLIDGHARKELTVGTLKDLCPVPVLLGRWTIEQERRLLITLDPIAAMAVENTEAMGRLLVAMNRGEEQIDDLLNSNAEGLDELIDRLAGDTFIRRGGNALEESAFPQFSDGAQLDEEAIDNLEEHALKRCGVCGQFLKSAQAIQTYEKTLAKYRRREKTLENEKENDKTNDTVERRDDSKHDPVRNGGLG